jgi:hypothetical protein
MNSGASAQGWQTISGTGTLTNFSAGTLSPLFITGVANPTSAPALSFSLSNFSADNIFGNFTGSPATPSTQAIPACPNDGTHALVYVSHVLTCELVTVSGSGTVTPSAQYDFLYFTNSGTSSVVGGAAVTGVVIGSTSGAPTGITETDGDVLYGSGGAWTKTNAPALAGTSFTAIPNGALSNSAITVNGTSASLGGSVNANYVTGSFTTGHAVSAASSAGEIQDAGAFNPTLVGLSSVTNDAQLKATTIANTVIVGAIPNGTSTSAAPWTATPTLGGSGTPGTLAFGNATSGTVKLSAVTGALGSGTLLLPVPAGVGRAAQVIFSGTLTLYTGSIASTACQAVTAGSVNSVAAAGVTSASSIIITPTSSLVAVTGFTAATTGGLNLKWYPTSGYINVDVCNPSSGALAPGPVTLNLLVIG